MIYLSALFTIDKTKKVLQLNIEVPYPKNCFTYVYFIYYEVTVTRTTSIFGKVNPSTFYSSGNPPKFLLQSYLYSNSIVQSCLRFTIQLTRYLSLFINTEQLFCKQLIIRHIIIMASQYDT